VTFIVDGFDVRKGIISGFDVRKGIIRLDCFD